MFDKEIVMLIGELLLGGGYLLWLLTGIVNAAVNTKTWSWKKTLTDLSKALLMAVVLLGLVALSDGLNWYAGLLGYDISTFTDGASTTMMLGGIVAGIATYYGRAVKNAMNFFRLPTDVKAIDQGAEPNYEAIAEAAKKTVGDIVETLTTPKKLAEKHETYETEGGRGSVYVVNINTYDAFRNEVLGKGYDVDNAYGYQCWDGCALLWQQIGRSLLTGNGCASGCWTLKRDVNAGNDFTLITNKSDVRRGDVVVFSTGQYGHIGFADENYNGGASIRLLGQNQGGTPKGAAGGAGFNVINMSMATFLGAFRFKNWTTSGSTTPTTPQKANEVIADEVIAGKWGNGDDRKKALQAAGYDYNTIQAIVNAKLTPVTPPKQPTKVNFAVGDTVVPTRAVDYTGRALYQYDPTYVITQLNGDRAVLSARGSIWAAMNIKDLKKA